MSGSNPLARRRPLLVLLLVVTAVSAARCVRQPSRPSVPSGPPIPTVHVRLGDPGAPVRTLSLDDYVTGVLLTEMPLGGLDSETALRVAELQAIVTRTYAVSHQDRHANEGFDLCATTHCQVYRPADTWPAPLAAIAAAATARTAGLVITHDGRPIDALYHADCGGRTSDAGVAWGGLTPPYLHGVADSFCLRESPTVWRFELDEPTLRRVLNRDRRTAVGSRLERVEVLERDAAGRALRLRLRGDRDLVVRGEELRAVLSAELGARSVMSTRFEVRRADERFVFAGQGYGHGIGLCQRGAIARARLGHSPASIIAHYYAGTRVVRMAAFTPARFD